MAAAERKPRALVIDDDEGMRANMEVVLEADAFEVVTAVDGADGLARLDRQSFDIVLLDIQMPGMDGLGVLQIIREHFPDVEVLMVTVLKEIPTVVEAMKLGAWDFITKDFRASELKIKARQALAHKKTARRMAYLADEVARTTPGEMILGSGPAMSEVATLAEKVAPLPATVLILGESGTGKELMARRIHRLWCAARGGSQRPIVTVNVAAIQGDLLESTLFGHEKGAFTGAHEQKIGKFELADGGTLFLDEIGDLRLDLQAKLLRAIQESEIERVGGKRPIPVDVRFVAATNVDLQRAVHEGRFREDLYYRLNVFPVRMPPLREHIEDVPELARHFLATTARAYGKPVLELSDRALDVLVRYPWPGNVRELENQMQRLVIKHDKPVIDDVDLPIEFSYPRFYDEAKRRKADGLAVALETFERSFISMTLERTGWHRKAAAAELGIGYSTIKKKIKKLGLVPPGGSPADEDDEPA